MHVNNTQTKISDENSFATPSTIMVSTSVNSVSNIMLSQNNFFLPTPNKSTNNFLSKIIICWLVVLGCR